MNSFCTIIDSNYIAFANALYSSIAEFDKEIRLNVLVTDAEKNNLPPTLNQHIKFYSISDLGDILFAKEIYSKYAATNKDVFRWALKPVFIIYLLQSGHDKIIYTDPDIFFVNDFSFLFKELDTAAVLLTPHWSSTIPLDYDDDLLSLMRNGLYNAGFIGASQNGLPAMRWWAGACHYKMEKKAESGVYDDQKYLDVLPIAFDKIKIITHKGCNLAVWNINSNKREIVDGQLKIDGIYDPVFIHFTNKTIEHILNYNDHFLLPYLKKYKEAFSRQNLELEKPIPSLNFSTKYYLLKKIKWTIRLRTRIKRFIFNVAEKL